MSILPWVILLLASVYAAHWGADKIAEPLQKLRQQWGFSEAAGAAFVAFATASPEIGTNTTSAIRGLSDIGLGNLLGSNIISVPAIVTVAYIASWWRNRKKSRSNSKNLNYISLKPLKVKSEALYVQAIPYLLIITLAALITLPKPWRGLQPIDAWIMLAAYVIYLGNAVLRHRRSEEHTSELQSHSDLVCRLLLEKKNQTKSPKIHSQCIYDPIYDNPIQLTLVHSSL